jgi:hypothetical protein
VQRCATCSGVFVKELDVLHIVHTKQKVFEEHIIQRGQLIRRQVKPMKQSPFDGIYDEKSVVCPLFLRLGAIKAINGHGETH